MAFIPQTKVFITKIKDSTFAASDMLTLQTAFPNGEVIPWSFPTLVFKSIPDGEYLEVFPERISEAYFKHPLSRIIG